MIKLGIFLLALGLIVVLLPSSGGRRKIFTLRNIVLAVVLFVAFMQLVHYLR